MARNKYPEVTVNRILDTAMKLFMAKGYENTTISDIVNELGDLSKGAIYHHFKSKEEILDAVATRIADNTTDIARVKMEQDLNGLEKLKLVLTSSISFARHEEMSQIMPSFMKNSYLLMVHMRDTMGEAVELLMPFVEEGIADGSIRTETPRELAEMILLFFNVWINPWIYRWTAEELDRKFSVMKITFEAMGVPLLTEENRKQLRELHALGLKAE